MVDYVMIVRYFGQVRVLEIEDQHGKSTAQQLLDIGNNYRFGFSRARYSKDHNSAKNVRVDPALSYLFQVVKKDGQVENIVSLDQFFILLEALLLRIPEIRFYFGKHLFRKIG